MRMAQEFNPLTDDPEFVQNLYRRQEILKKPFSPDALKFRHGIAPIMKNIRNVRFKKEPNVDSLEVHAVETILKDIIDVR